MSNHVWRAKPHSRCNPTYIQIHICREYESCLGVYPPNTNVKITVSVIF
jgi:hypothetical protein